MSSTIFELYKVLESKVFSILKDSNKLQNIVNNYVGKVYEVASITKKAHVIAVDSSFLEIHYTTYLRSIISIAGLCSYKKPLIMIKISPLIGNELADEAKALEYKIANKLLSEINDEENLVIILIDGLLSSGSYRCLRELKRLLSNAKSRNCVVLAHTKYCTEYRYINNTLSIDENLIIYLIMKKYREVTSSERPLFMMPKITYVKGIEEKVGITYVQYRVNSLPILIEYLPHNSPYISESICTISRLCNSEFFSGYPLPLYIVDKLCKITLNDVEFIKFLVNKLTPPLTLHTNFKYFLKHF